MFSWENTSSEIASDRPEIAILPVGATEQHGMHLPLATDALIAEDLSRAVAEKLDAFLLPVIPISNSQEHQDFMGSLWIQPDTLARVITDICRALKRHGFRKIVVLGVHGGNWILKPTVRQINLNDLEMMVILAGLDAGGKGVWGADGQIHAGKIETSCILHLRPELVKGAGVDCQPDVPQGYIDYVGMKGCTPKGAWGSPSAASAELGRKVLADSVVGIVDYVRTTFAFIERTRNPKATD